MNYTLFSQIYILKPVYRNAPYSPNKKPQKFYFFYSFNEIPKNSHWKRYQNVYLQSCQKKVPIYSHPMLVLICGKDLSSFLFVFVNLSLRKKLPFQSKSELIINDQK